MKLKRHSEILEIVKKQDIETQEELTEILRSRGFNITQATISRDIKELKLGKILSENGRQKYTILDINNNEFSQNNSSILSQSVVSMNYSQNILVIKTLSGMAMAAAAQIDAMDLEEIVGTIAGDDTIFCVVKGEKQLENLLDKLKLFR